LVRMPSRCAWMTATLMDRERPKSSALTMRRRTNCRLPIADCRLSARSIIGCGGADRKAQPALENQKDFISAAEPCRLRAKNVELLRFQLEQQPPVNRTHQFGGDHGPAIFGGQGFAGEAIEILGAGGEMSGEPAIAVGIFGPQNLLRSNAEFFQIGERQINPAASGVGADVAQDVGELQRLA